MRNIFLIIWGIFLSAFATAQDLYFRIDSLSPGKYYFVSQRITYDADSNRVVSEKQTKFTTLSAARSYGNSVVLPQLQADSATARQALVLADSLKARVRGATSGNPTPRPGVMRSTLPAKEAPAIKPDPIITGPTTKKPPKKLPKKQ